MSPLRRPLAGSLATTRRMVARRPWLYWLLVVLVASGFGLWQRGRDRVIETERARWGETTDVLVAVDRHSPGDPIHAEVRTVPAAVVPEFAIGVSATQDRPSVARQRIGPGEIITTEDVAPGSGPMALAPEGWVVVPAEEAIASGVEIGDRVMIVSDGFMIADDAVVVGRYDDAVLLAVPVDDATIVPAAVDAAGVTLVRTP